MTPKMGAPRPWERSKNSENEPTVWLRSSSGALVMATVNRAGKSSDMPMARKTVPIHRPATEATRATVPMPAAMHMRAMLEARTGPNRSGTRAPKMRTARTMMP